MIQRPARAFKPGRVLSALLCFLLSNCLPQSGASARMANGSPNRREQQSASKNLTMLLVDTDDACRLFLDDEDKGVITSAQTQRFKVSLGEHILKCTIEAIPDLTWRKVVDVKDSSQVAAVITLKALHVQYDQAAAKAKSEKDQAEAAAAARLQEAKLEEKQRETTERERQAAIAAVPQRMLEMIKGDWYGVLVDSIFNRPVSYLYHFESIENGAVVGYLIEEKNTKYEFAYIPVPPDRFEATGSWLCVSTKLGFAKKPGAPKDNQGWTECKQKAYPFNGRSISLVNKNTLELHDFDIGDGHSLTLTR
jgi:hypothetical protein